MSAHEKAHVSSHLITLIERHWPIFRVVRLRRIRRGLVNQNFKVTVAGGQHYVLRLYHPEIGTARIGQEHALLERLKKAGFSLSPRLVAPKTPPTWKPVALPEEAHHYLALMTHLPGEDRYTWEAPPQSTAAADALGAALARYHEAIQGWLPLADDIAAKEVDMVRRLGMTLGNEARALATLESLSPALADLDRSAWPVLMVHGDFHAANVRWAEEDRICGIFDFEYAAPNWRLYDVGMAAACLATRWADAKLDDGRLNPALLNAFTSGYDSAIDPEGSLPRLLSGEKAALPHYLALSHLLTLEWVLTPATRKRLGDTAAQAYARHTRRALARLAQSDGLG
ncbi:MAG: aminoglycoside phosphotransferase family protein [Desulfosarcinaceae bacterium]